MIKEMVICELVDLGTGDVVTHAVDIETLEFYVGTLCGGMFQFHDLATLDPSEFFFAACDYLEQHMSIDTDQAKIDIWY
jgi:hypothetical protein